MVFGDRRRGVRRSGIAALVAVFAVTAAACGSGGAGDGAAVPAATGTSQTGPSAQPQSATTAAGGAATPAAGAPYACDGSDLLASLSTRQKLAQMLVVGVTGTQDALDVVTSEQVGGVFVGSWTDPSMLTGGGAAAVHDADIAAPPPMITIDEEGGRVSRVADLIGPAPSAREVARTMSVDEAYRMALERGKKLRGLGITVDFAPDADVSAQSDDAVIGDRSYSDDPQTVADYAGAVARGLRDAGVHPVIKHFPGHGSSSGDSHNGAVSVPPLAQLQGRDLMPFRQLIAEQPDVGVMVGHLDVPGLTDGVPASLSPAAMSLLRDGTGYDAPPFGGVIFTDDLSGMGAISDTYSVPDAVAAALEAGADVALWLSTDQVPAVLDRLEQEVDSGTLPIDRVDDSVVRIARMKGILSCG
ncbi:glycoside hydrolase family 3 N-terminal domain-containing protein [Tomitella cavernea]|uniref:beta-N-acetylhexosaminidase n=1 Tax=Tomitella cavernea TaxID=1387982 RepID=A0ABP9D3X0_9ACTN|nr:glycoside hydrolase family 3 N-terminal domain-containing protein [Tomitella cavernea]